MHKKDNLEKDIFQFININVVKISKILFSKRKSILR